MSTILLCGDFAPNSKNETDIANEKVEIIIGYELKDIFEKHDIVGMNLETSLVRTCTPKKKRGQINQTTPDICSFLQRAGVSVCFLANNHVIDNGNAGIISTIESLDYYGIEHIGAGKSIEEASKSYDYNDSNGNVIRILNIANDEFNSVSEDQYGVNTLDLLSSFYYIREQKRNAEYLIVVFHGGVEYFQYPTPMLQRICRKMIDSGADLVTCQHSHCIGTYEEYKSGYIFYGQGNFLFDDSNNPLEKTAVLLSVNTENKIVRIIPISKMGSLVRICNKEQYDDVLQQINSRNREIQDAKKVRALFERFVDNQEREVLNACVGYNKIFKALNKLTKGRVAKNVFNSNGRMRLYNMLRSVSLLEIMEEVMSRYE